MLITLCYFVDYPQIEHFPPKTTNLDRVQQPNRLFYFYFGVFYILFYHITKIFKYFNGFPYYTNSCYIYYFVQSYYLVIIHSIHGFGHGRNYVGLIPYWCIFIGPAGHMLCSSQASGSPF